MPDVDDHGAERHFLEREQAKDERPLRQLRTVSRAARCD
jgi:hypothetical protein